MPNSNFNLRLIIPTHQDPNRRALVTKLGWATKYVFLGILTVQFVLPSSYLGSSHVADASIRSAVSSILGIEAIAAESEVGTNSQKMPLLEAPANFVIIPLSASATPLTENRALIASTLIVASTTGATTLKADTSDAPTDSQIKTYKVKAGDTVSDIAKQFGISANTIIWANTLPRENSIKVGQTLVILPINGVKYVVKAGDSVSGIASKFKGDNQEIIAYNDIQGGTLKVGETILIPDGIHTVSQAPAIPKAVATAKTSVVQKVASAALGIGVAQADDVPSAPDPSPSGYYIRPISGGTRTQGVHGTNGVDLAASCGTAIYATAGGTVSVATANGSYNGGFGNYVVINHSNGSQSLYAHMKSVSITPGSSVDKGQQIGTIGATGKVNGATGCHVHFEIRNGPRNPF